MKIIDIIGVILIILGLSMTVLTFLAARQPVAPFDKSSEVQSFTLHELPSPRSELPSPRSEFAPRGAGGPFDKGSGSARSGQAPSAPFDKSSGSGRVL